MFFIWAVLKIIEHQDAGGLKEWNTDQGVDEESVLDSDAAALKKAEQEDMRVPIGEGENCCGSNSWRKGREKKRKWIINLLFNYVIENQLLRQQ